MSPLRILIVDDHPVVREGLEAILSTQPEFVVEAIAKDGSEALQIVAEKTIDVVLLDLEMPEMDGVEVLRQLQRSQTNIPVIVFTAYDTDERIVSAVRAGVKGYLLKGAPREELFNAIRVVVGGGSLLHPVVASKLMAHMSGPESDTEVRLTEREMDVLVKLAQGLQNKEIARDLVISERTVKFHVSSILKKLNAGNRTEAVSLAAQQGLISLTE